jgi:hypothetical protein
MADRSNPQWGVEPDRSAGTVQADGIARQRDVLEDVT